jgi:hypothetical protein
MRETDTAFSCVGIWPKSDVWARSRPSPGWMDAGHFLEALPSRRHPVGGFAGDFTLLDLRPNTQLDHAVPARSLAAPAL